MKKLMPVVVMIVVLFSSAWSDVNKTTQTSIHFQGFGKLALNSTVIYKGQKKMTLDQNKFKGEGFAGKMVGFFFPKDQKGTLISLDEMKQYDINYKKQEYTVTNIEKIDVSPYLEEAAEKGGTETAGEQEQGDNIEIVRNDFTVKETGEKQQIAGFASSLYEVTWIIETINHTQNTHKADSLRTNIWTTRDEARLKAALDEETAFNKAYLAAIGISLNDEQQEMLGLKWLELLKKMQSASAKNQGGEEQMIISNQMTEEMKKISGYPVKYDGAFYVKDFNQQAGAAGEQSEEAVEEDEGTDVSSPKSALGGMFGKKLKQKMSKKSKTSESAGGYSQLFNYAYEMITVSTDPVAGNEVSVPKGFSQKEAK